MKRSHYYLFNEGLKSDNKLIQEEVYEKLFIKEEISEFAKLFRNQVEKLFPEIGYDAWRDKREAIFKKAADECLKVLRDDLLGAKVINKRINESINKGEIVKKWYTEEVKNILLKIREEVREEILGVLSYHKLLLEFFLESDNESIQNDVYYTLFEDIENSSFAKLFKKIIYEIFMGGGIDPKNYNEYYNRVKADAASRCYMHLLELSKKDQINISYSAEGWFYRVITRCLQTHWGEIMEYAFGNRLFIPLPPVPIDQDDPDEGSVINSKEEKSDKSGNLRGEDDLTKEINEGSDNLEELETLKVVMGGGDNSEEGSDDTESIEERIYGYIDDISHQGSKGNRYASLIKQIGLYGVSYEQFAEDEGIVFKSDEEKKQYLAGLRLDYSRAIGCLLAIALPDFRRLAVTIYNDLVKWNELDSFIASTFRNGATDDQIEERRNIIKSICLGGQPANNDEKRRLIKGVFERHKEISNKLVENNKKYFQDYRWLYNHYRNSTEQLRFELKIGVNELNELRDHFENEEIFKRFFEVDRQVYLKLTKPERGSVKDYLSGIVLPNVNRRLSQNDFRVLDLGQLIDLVQNKLSVYGDNYLEQHPVLVLNTNMNDCLDEYFKYGKIKDDNLFYNAICRLGNGAEYIQKNLGEISKDVKQHFDLFVGNHESLIEDNSVEEIVELFNNSYKINSEQRQEKEKKIVELLFG